MNDKPFIYEQSKTELYTSIIINIYNHNKYKYNYKLTIIQSNSYKTNRIAKPDFERQYQLPPQYRIPDYSQ